MRFRKGTFTVVPNKEVLRGQPAIVLSVYFWICDHADQDGECFPSIKKLSQDAGCSETATKDAISQLVTLGVLAKESRKNGEEYLSNKYYVMCVETQVGQEATHPPVARRLLTVPILTKQETRAPQKAETPPPFVPKKKFRPYSESDPGDDLPSLDSETGEEVREAPKTNASKDFVELLKWAAERRGGPFINIAKQFKALSKMKAAGITRAEIRTRWEELENDEFHRDKGLDFMSVSSSFDRKPPHE